MFCTACGKEIDNNLKFCIHCGAPVENTPAAEPKSVNHAPVEAGQQTVSTAAFVGWDVLFSLPIIGLFASLLTMLLAQNKNLKNYARAKLIWQLIGLGILVILIAVAVWLGSDLLEYINE